MLDIRITSGTSKDLVFPIDSELDLTGAIAALSVRPIFSTSSGQITLRENNGLDIDSAKQIVTARFQPSDTRAIPDGRYVYDLFLKLADQRTLRVEHGYFTIDTAQTKNLS
jgi:hypothetical protein